MRIKPLVALLILSTGLSVQAMDDAPQALSDQHVVLNLQNGLRSGQLVYPASETEFRIKLDAGGSIVALQWEQLDAVERHRVQRLYGMDAEAREGFGNRVTGVRFTLQDSKFIEGLRVSQQDKPGYKALKTGTMPLVLVPEALIVSESAIERPESAFYTATEIYDRWIFEKPPGANDAAAHLELAHRTAASGLYDRARFHLDCAAYIDPRTVEHNAAFRRDVVRHETEDEALALYVQLLSRQRSGDFFGALDALESLKTCFPNSDLTSRLGALRTELENAKDDDQARRVVSMSYAVADQLIRRKVTTRVQVDEKGNAVQSIPGKVIVTKTGVVFKGVLDTGTDASISPDMLVLKDGDRHYSIAKTEILKIRDENICKGVREADPDLEELKSWASDLRRPDGLKATMVQRLAELTGLPSGRVSQIFDARLQSSMTYEKGSMKRTLSYATAHDVKYGVASWLRDGAKVAPLQQWEVDQELNKEHLGATRSGKNARPDVVNGGFKPAPVEARDEAETQRVSKSDDPAIWWCVQNIETRYNYVKALAAEKVFSAIDVQKPACKYCGGRGFIKIANDRAENSEMRCLCCKGMSVEFKISYH